MPPGRPDTVAGQKTSTGSVKRLARAPSMRWAKRFACAIRSTGSSYPGRLALCAAERRPTPITFGLSSLVRWAAGSVTSSRYHCVASTTVSFTAKVTRLHGGVISPLILYRWRSDYGSTHGSMARRSRPVEAPSLGLQPQRKSPSKAQPARALIPATMRGAAPPNLPMASQTNDLVSTDRGQSRQCAQKHRSKDRSWQTTVAAKRSSARIDRRNRRCRSGRHRRLSSIRSGCHRGLRRPNGRGARAGAPACIAVVANTSCHRH